VYPRAELRRCRPPARPTDRRTKSAVEWVEPKDARTICVLEVEVSRLSCIFVFVLEVVEAATCGREARRVARLLLSENLWVVFWVEPPPVAGAGTSRAVRRPGALGEFSDLLSEVMTSRLNLTCCSGPRTADRGAGIGQDGPGGWPFGISWMTFCNFLAPPCGNHAPR
jgi:hypothetical protein